MVFVQGHFLVSLLLEYLLTHLFLIRYHCVEFNSFYYSFEITFSVCQIIRQFFFRLLNDYSINSKYKINHIESKIFLRMLYTEFQKPHLITYGVKFKFAEMKQTHNLQLLKMFSFIYTKEEADEKKTYFVICLRKQIIRISIPLNTTELCVSKYNSTNGKYFVITYILDVFSFLDHIKTKHKKFSCVNSYYKFRIY